MDGNSLLSLRTAGKQPLTLNDLVLLQPWHDDLQSKVQDWVAQHLNVSLLYGSSSFNHFIQKKLSWERKIVPWHSHTVGLLACPRSFIAGTTDLLSTARDKYTAHKVVYNVFITTYSRVARQIVLLPSTAEKVFVNTAASRLILYNHTFIDFHFKRRSQRAA